MKGHNIIYIIALSIIVFAGCNKEEQTSLNKEKKISRSIKTKYNILCGEKIPPIVKEMVMGESEIFCDYTFTDCQQIAPKPKVLRLNRNNASNTYHLDTPHKLKLTIEDTCRVEESEKQIIHHVTRLTNTAWGDSLKNASNPSVRRVLEFTYNSHLSEPISIIRPYATPCDPIPLCYYHNLEIEWNEDVYNTSGVGIIIEWNGVKMLEPAVNNRVVGIDFVDDLGRMELNDAIFDDIPHGALVYMWLFRFDVATIEMEDNTEYTLRDVLRDEDLLEELIEADPEFTLQLRNIFALNGSVAMLPFFLIRNLTE